MDSLSQADTVIPDWMEQLLTQLQSGELTVDETSSRIAAQQSQKSIVTESAQIDLDRTRRCGFPEVVFCEGKTPDAICEIFEILHAHGESVLGTRISPEQAEVVLLRFPDAIHRPVGRTIRIPAAAEKPETPNSGQPVGRVAVITAGTSDRPVAEEAMETLCWMGCDPELIVDVGVAGPHRLPEHLHRLQDLAAVVVVAGMEGALPSVVGGWVACPVIAVPTSVGYGANFGGLSALLGMLNSCASNVTVVNIDSGFKGAYVAGLIARRSA